MTRIGSNNPFREYVTVHSATGDQNATVIGSHNNLLAYTHVAYDCQLGDLIIMSNVGTLAGHVTVEDRAIVGGLAAVHQFSESEPCRSSADAPKSFRMYLRT